MDTKEIIIKLKNQLIQDDINLSSYDDNELRQWLVANFINVLCDLKFFVDQVTLLPISDDLYSTLFKISCRSPDSVSSSSKDSLNTLNFEIEFGIVSLNKLYSKSLTTLQNRLSLIFFSNNLEITPIFNDLNGVDYNIIKLESGRVLILY